MKELLDSIEKVNEEPRKIAKFDKEFTMQSVNKYRKTLEALGDE